MPAHVPVSFVFDGRHIAGIPEEWHPTTTRRRIDANMVETVFKGTEKATGLQIRVECIEYADFPVVEWTAWLRNTGEQPSPLISDLQALDGAFAGTGAVLTHCNGDFYSEEGYTPQETPLTDGVTLTMAPQHGRSCDKAFPYFRLCFDGGGLTLAVGWPAEWSASFTGMADGAHVTAGQKTTHLRLLPGECIRTPRITLLSWSGEEERGINLWRRWYLAHVLPRVEGQPLRPLLAAAGTDEGVEFTAATEDNQLRFQNKFATLGIAYDVWWIDAGWYPCFDEQGERNWVLTGTWEPEAERFPRGLRPIAENAAKHDARLLVWFEPERVRDGSWLATERQEWLLYDCDAEGRRGTSFLLDLGNPACRQWLTDHVCALIRDNGIGIYRQDFNFSPLPYWHQDEPADRKGLRENLHVQGYLQFWDDLLARNPGLWIDSCASGGRRNDLESMRRSVPLHYTDYGYGNHPVKLAFHQTMFAWLPYFKEVTLSWDVCAPDENHRFDKVTDSFSFHCGFAPMLILGMDIRRDDHDAAFINNMTGIWRRAAEFMLSDDYYPLTPFSRRPDRWVARQFDRPQTGEGFLQGIRLPDEPTETLTVYPKSCLPEATYVFENPESGEQISVSGTVLLNEGFTFTLPPRSGAIWFYRRCDR
ncbi:MAG: alpha-galactosidase [Armatimonadota bacterium]